jgi:hypothetical protein
MPARVAAGRERRRAAGRGRTPAAEGRTLAAGGHTPAGGAPAALPARTPAEQQARTGTAAEALRRDLGKAQGERIPAAPHNLRHRAGHHGVEGCLRTAPPRAQRGAPGGSSFGPLQSRAPAGISRARLAGRPKPPGVPERSHVARQRAASALRTRPGLGLAEDPRVCHTCCNTCRWVWESPRSSGRRS